MHRILILLGSLLLGGMCIAADAGDDDVEASIRKLAEVEAAKMWELAEQYRRMGTREGDNASKFLLCEIARRYPDTHIGEKVKELLPPEEWEKAKNWRDSPKPPDTPEGRRLEELQREMLRNMPQPREGQGKIFQEPFDPKDFKRFFPGTDEKLHWVC